MFVFGEFFRSLAFLVDGVCTLLSWLIVARIVISWFPVDPYHGIVQFLMQVTDPLLVPLRRLPLQIGMLDLSPLLAFFILHFVNNILTRILLTFAYQLGVS